MEMIEKKQIMVSETEFILHWFPSVANIDNLNHAFTYNIQIDLLIEENVWMSNQEPIVQSRRL